MYGLKIQFFLITNIILLFQRGSYFKSFQCKIGYGWYFLHVSKKTKEFYYKAEGFNTLFNFSLHKNIVMTEDHSILLSLQLKVMFTRNHLKVFQNFYFTCCQTNNNLNFISEKFP